MSSHECKYSWTVFYDSVENAFSGRQKAENEITRSCVPWKRGFGPFLLWHLYIVNRIITHKCYKLFPALLARNFIWLPVLKTLVSERFLEGIWYKESSQLTRYQSLEVLKLYNDARIFQLSWRQNNHYDAFFCLLTPYLLTVAWNYISECYRRVSCLWRMIFEWTLLPVVDLLVTVGPLYSGQHDTTK